MNISKEDYLKLLHDLANQQYDSDEESISIPDESWMPSEPAAKERMKNITFSGMVDATNLRKDQIKAAIGRSQNIQVGSFSIRLSEYYGTTPLEKGVLSFTVYGKQTKTPNGHPCNMDVHADLAKDNRFADRPWLSYFNGSSAREVPIDTIIDIIRWMQAIKRLTCFL